MVPTGYTLLLVFPDGSQNLVDYVGAIPREGDPHLWRWHVAGVEPGGMVDGRHVGLRCPPRRRTFREK